MTENERIEGKVAQVLNERELVINRGAAHGVTKGMAFAVLNRRGAEITDPDTGEALGSVEIPKVLVKAVRVDDHLTVARTFRSVRVNRGGDSQGGGLLQSLWRDDSRFNPPKWEEVPETLNLADRPHLVEIDPEESYVKIGDPVVQYEGEEFVHPKT